MKSPLHRIFDEVWNAKDRRVIDELVAPDYIHHDPQAPDMPGGVEAYKHFVEQYLSAFPDLHMRVEDEIVAGDKSVTRWTASGTHKGQLLGFAPTGKSFRVEGITIATMKDGKFVESWNNWDALGMMRQLGAIPSGEAGRAA